LDKPRTPIRLWKNCVLGWDSCGGFKEGQGQLVRPIQEDDMAAADALPYKVDNDPRDRVEMDFGLDEVGRWKRPEMP
jgi:hypothetical protein